MTVSKEEILKTLEGVKDPITGQDIVSLRYVSSIIIKDGNVGFVLEVTEAHKPHAEALMHACEKAVGKLPGIRSVTVVPTAERSISLPEKPARPAPPTPKPLAGIKHVLAVTSGKGGVGKSTVAVYLALSLARNGYKVGLVDADIQGPSVAQMMGLAGEPSIEENQMIPPERHGIKCMSMALLLGDSPAIWRGPMVSKALRQLFYAVKWGELDYLIVDMPPGTGDIHLSIAQNFEVAGAVIVSTPQEVALADVRRCIAMYQKVNIPILGMVENMSYLVDPETGRTIDIFGRGGAQKAAQALDIRFLGEIPLEPAIARLADQGETLIVNAPSHSLSRTFKEVADKVTHQLEESN